MSSKKKLSKVQQIVVDKMREGWALGVSNNHIHSRAWLQKDGLGRGGDTIDVRSVTVFALAERGIIEVTKKGFPTTTYSLTHLAS